MKITDRGAAGSTACALPVHNLRSILSIWVAALTPVGDKKKPYNANSAQFER
jgi:hypothetical protein